MPTTYTHTTFAQAKQRLASLLGDDGKVFYVDTELGLYIIEALRWWGLTTQYFRQTATIHLTPGTAWYDVTLVAKDSGGNLLQSLTVTDRNVITDITYAVMEPPITAWGGGWVGTEMFTLEEITDLLRKNRDDILRDSGILTYETSYPMVLGQQRLDLDQDTIKILRMSVEEVSSDGPLPMWGMDYYQAQSTSPTASFPTVGRPKAFALNYTPWLAVDVYPPPQVPLTLRTYSAMAGADLTPTSAATVLGLPDDACWIAKYQTLEDMLAGDGLARAPELSEYCNMRAEDGLRSLHIYQSMLWSTVGGRRMTISPVGQMELSRPDWEQTSGEPRALHPIAWNLFAVRPVPAISAASPTGEYDIDVELVTKAPIPTVDGDFIQVGQEFMPALYDYAQHVAMFKCQGQEFIQSLDLYKGAMETAMEALAQQASLAPHLKLQMRQALDDRNIRPLRIKQLAQEVLEVNA